MIESQKGALEKFVTSSKQNITEKLGDSSTNENNSYDSQLKDNIMSQERLSGLTILSIERNMLEKIYYKNLINTFASKRARKMKF